MRLDRVSCIKKALYLSFPLAPSHSRKLIGTSMSYHPTTHEWMIAGPTTTKISTTAITVIAIVTAPNLMYPHGDTLLQNPRRVTTLIPPLNSKKWFQLSSPPHLGTPKPSTMPLLLLLPAIHRFNPLTRGCHPFVQSPHKETTRSPTRATRPKSQGSSASLPSPHDGTHECPLSKCYG